MRNPDFFSGRLGNRMFQMAYLYAEAKRGNIEDWYLQSPHYFAGHEEEIKQLFGEGIGYLDQVGVHIRRGANPANPAEPPYHANPFYVNLADDTSYYADALKLFPDDKFLVFSDEPGEAEEIIKKILPAERYQVMEKGDEVLDMNLLASCKGIIGSNSSYAWWAGFLNPNPSAKIVFPSSKNWYRDGIERTVCPQSWVRI